MALCGSCFREISGDVCPFCGFDGAEQKERYPVALLPGSILNGQYVVGRVLGQGGFGITYLAMDDRAGTRVAIKEFYPAEFAARGGDGATVQVLSGNRAENFVYGKNLFLEEARTLAAVLGDRHIVRIYSYFEENGTAYFAMEYVEGVPLDEYLRGRGGHLSAQEAEDLFLPLMAALETVHKKGIVHRDIAPDNVIVTKDGTAKLIDFGAARYSTGEKSKSLDVILKHGFAPMEQYTRRGRQGPWTDVYAMAATYYYAVTGKVPPDAIDRITGDTLEKPSALGVNLGKATEAVLLKALSVQAPERWQNMGEFRAALQTAAMAEAEERKKAEQERLAREAREREAREKAERLEREKRERAERAAQKKAEREAARAARQTQKSAEPAKKKNPLPWILAAAAVLALVAFGATRLAKNLSPALPAPPAETQVTEPTATPAPYTVEENGLTYTVYADHAEVTVADKALKSVEVPDTLEGKPVTGIGHWAFQDCRSLTSITLPEGVTSIGDYAFFDCTRLTRITLPQKVDSIGVSVFSSSYFHGRAPLSISIHAPAGSYAAEFFKGDPRLVIDPPVPFTLEENGLTFTIQASHAEVTAADQSLTSVTVPAMAGGRPVTGIGSRAFYRCTGLTSITLPEGVTSIGDYAFDGCSNLREITLPEGVTNIGDSVFSYCRNLTSITLPESVTGIGDSAFSGCTGLTGITLPKGLTRIGDSAFYGCTGLTGITLPKSVTDIGNGAFSGCTGLTGITLLEGVTSIGSLAFTDCNHLTSITLPESVTSIGYHAFNDYLDQPLNMSIHVQPGSYAAEFFKDDPRLVIDPAVPYTVEENGLTFTIQADHAEVTAADQSLTSVTVPAMAGGRPVTGIGDRAFKNCSNLSSITLPESVTGIGDWSFNRCTGLSGIALPESLTNIGNYAFSGCTGLTDITLPEGLTSIGYRAFSDCTRLTSITLPEGLTSIAGYAFSGCTKMTSISLPESVTSIGGSAFSGCTRLTSISLPEGVTSIGGRAFYGCTGLTSITLPEGLTSIGYRAFSGCTGLTGITLPEGVASIGDHTFDHYHNGEDQPLNMSIHAPAGSYAAEFFKDDPRLVIDE